MPRHPSTVPDDFNEMNSGHMLTRSTVLTSRVWLYDCSSVFSQHPQHCQSLMWASNARRTRLSQAPVSSIWRCFWQTHAGTCGYLVPFSSVPLIFLIFQGCCYRRTCRRRSLSRLARLDHGTRMGHNRKHPRCKYEVCPSAESATYSLMRNQFCWKIE